MTHPAPAHRPLRRLAFIIMVAVASMILLTPSFSFSASSVSTLRKEKARLTDLREKAEKAARELTETMAREVSTKEKVAELSARLSRQRKTIERIDRKLETLSAELDLREAESRSLEEEQVRVRKGLSAAVASVDAGDRESLATLPPSGIEERNMAFARTAFGLQMRRDADLSTSREQLELRMEGLSEEIDASEKRMEREQKTGDTIASRQEIERRNLAGLEEKKKRKEKEVRELAARVARLESVVSRIEKELAVREKKSGRSKSSGPSRFPAVPGGFVAPVDGSVVVAFGKSRDPLFDVVVESRGVEIAGSPGAAVRAVAKGEVVFEGPVTGFGNVLILQHGTGLFSVLGKAASFSPKVGALVAKGDVVGRLGASGEDGRPVIYLELRAGGNAVDPSTVVPLKR